MLLEFSKSWWISVNLDEKFNNYKFFDIFIRLRIFIISFLCSHIIPFLFCHQGLVMMIPAFILVGASETNLGLYAGLTLYALGNVILRTNFKRQDIFEG